MKVGSCVKLTENLAASCRRLCIIAKFQVNITMTTTITKAMHAILFYLYRVVVPAINVPLLLLVLSEVLAEQHIQLINWHPIRISIRENITVSRKLLSATCGKLDSQ